MHKVFKSKHSADFLKTHLLFAFPLPLLFDWPLWPAVHAALWRRYEHEQNHVVSAMQSLKNWWSPASSQNPSWTDSPLILNTIEHEHFGIVNTLFLFLLRFKLWKMSFCHTYRDEAFSSLYDEELKPVPVPYLVKPWAQSCMPLDPTENI